MPLFFFRLITYHYNKPEDAYNKKDIKKATKGECIWKNPIGITKLLCFY